MSAYSRRISTLFSRTGSTAKLGLERTSALLTRLGDPHRSFRSFHIAGTNGKGSVVAMLYALLRDKGLRVGRYTSPHLVDFRERIVVDDEQISEQEVVVFLDEWEAEADRSGATFFELTTALAFAHFARCDVDVAVIETGMGGRLDATNVLTPVVTGVTSVGLDHAEYLGESAAEIAREKAGIFKPGVPAVIGPLPADARAVIERHAREIGARPFVDAPENYRVLWVRVNGDGTTAEIDHDGDTRSIGIGMVGAVQAFNLSVALSMLTAAGPPYCVPLADAARVLPGVRIPGRFQRIGKFVLDVAHNTDGIASLTRTLEDVQLPRPLIAVVGIMRDKPWKDMLRAIAAACDQVIVTTPASAPVERVWDPEEVLRSLGDSPGIVVVSALHEALARAEKDAATVLVTGSFHTVGDALSWVLRRGG